MTVLEKSYEEKVNEIISLSFKILYECNPNRIGWEKHSINVNDDIKGIKLNNSLPTDEYYLYLCYKHLLGEDLLEDIWYINEGFSQWVEKFETGKCSIHDTLNVYTFENLDKRIAEYEAIVKKAWDIRCKWVETVKIS